MTGAFAKPAECAASFSLRTSTLPCDTETMGIPGTPTIRPRAPGQTSGKVEAAVEADLARFPAELQTGALAAACRNLGRRIDGGMSARDVITATREIRSCMSTLVALAPVGEAGDVVDELRERRARRITAEAAAADTAT